MGGGGAGGRGRWLKIGKSALILETRPRLCPSLDQIFRWKCSFNSRLIQKFSLAGPFFSCVFDEMFIEVP